MRLIVFSIIIGLSLSFAPKAHALSCFFLSCSQKLIQSDLVFKGRAVFNGNTTPEMQDEYSKNRGDNSKGVRALPNAYTDFEIQTLYKGAPHDKIRIFYEVRRAGFIAGEIEVRPYPEGEETVIYASVQGGFYTTSRGYCSRCEGPQELEVIKARYDAIEDLIRAMPKAPEFYLKKIDLYEANKDFEASLRTYKRLFEAAPEMTQKNDMMLSFGRSLFLSRRYEEAINVLERLKSDGEALSYLQKSKLYAGQGDDLVGQKLQMSGAELNGLTIRDADFSGADFSGARLNGVKFENVVLRGADFTNAIMQVEFSGSDLTGAKFAGAKIKGKITDSKFDNASLTGAEVDLNEAGGSSFKAADFTSGKLYISDCRGHKDWRGNDFRQTNFTDATVSGLRESKTEGANFTNTNFYANKCMSQNQGVDLSGRKLDNTAFDLGDYTGASFKGASLRGATFKGANLTDVDFSGADLSGARFEVSSYSSAGLVKLEGANFTGAKTDGVFWQGSSFDCKTQFPPGFKPEDHQMQTKDRSCDLAATKNPGVVHYDAERLRSGYVTVCNGDYHADCIYGFLASFYSMPKSGFRREELLSFAQSFLDAGYPRLAETIALGKIGGIALSQKSLDPAFFADWLPIMEQVENSREAGANTKEMPDAASFLVGDKRTADARLAEAAKRALDAGDFDQALRYARKIGDKEFNQAILEWGNKQEADAHESRISYGPRLALQSQAQLLIAIEKYHQGQDTSATIKGLIEDIENDKPRNQHEKIFAAARGLAGIHSANPALMVYAHLLTGNTQKAWDIYTVIKTGRHTEGRLPLLSAMADYYARYPDEAGSKKLTEEIHAIARESLALRGSFIHPGAEKLFHESLFNILGTLKSGPMIKEVFSIVGNYQKPVLDAIVSLYAAEAFVKAGDIKSAFAHFEDFRKAVVAESATAQEQGTLSWFLTLGAQDGEALTKGKGGFKLEDKEVGSFILSVAMSGASQQDKVKALKIAEDLAALGIGASPLFRAQMAIAAAAVHRDAASEEKIKDAHYGVPASQLADLLHEAGFHTLEKDFIEAAWASSDAPPSIGLNRLGVHTGLQAMQRAQRITALAGMLARDGEFDLAERAVKSIINPAAVLHVRDTNFSAYFYQQKTLHDIAISAFQSGKKELALDIITADLSYAPYQAAAYFEIARAYIRDGQKEEAKQYYDTGYDLSSSFGAAVGSPMIDPEGVAVEGWVARAAVEAELGLPERYEQTLSYARHALSLSQNDIQRGKLASVVDRIMQLTSTKNGKEPAQSLDDFIESLRVRDDLNSTSVVRQAAEKYLMEGDSDRARALAMYGFRNIDRYPQSKTKAHLLRPFVSIIARTEARMSEETQSKIEEILKTYPPDNTKQSPDIKPAAIDFVEEGRIAYKELKKRAALDNAPPNEGDVLSQLQKSGALIPGAASDYARVWIENAVKKYTQKNPDVDIKVSDFLNEGPTGRLWTPDNRDFWLVKREIVLPTQVPGFSAYLVVPADVPRPKGRRHNATILYLSDFTCEGNFPPFCKY